MKNWSGITHRDATGKERRRVGGEAMILLEVDQPADDGKQRPADLHHRHDHDGGEELQRLQQECHDEI